MSGRKPSNDIDTVIKVFQRRTGAPDFRQPGEEKPVDIISQPTDCFPPAAESEEGKALLDQATLPSIFSELNGG